MVRATSAECLQWVDSGHWPRRIAARGSIPITRGADRPIVGNVTLAGAKRLMADEARGGRLGAWARGVPLPEALLLQPLSDFLIREWHHRLSRWTDNALERLTLDARQPKVRYGWKSDIGGHACLAQKWRLGARHVPGTCPARNSRGTEIHDRHGVHDWDRVHDRIKTGVTAGYRSAAARDLNLPGVCLLVISFYLCSILPMQKLDQHKRRPWRRLDARAKAAVVLGLMGGARVVDLAAGLG